MERAAWVAECKAWALENYERGGDVFVECWETSQYEEVFDRANGDVDRAWSTMDSVRSVWAERQADAAYYARGERDVA